MLGHSEALISISSVSWPDAELEQIYIDYEAVRLRILQSSGERVEVAATGYIGFSSIGFWDEVVIDRVELQRDHQIITHSLDSVRGRLGSEPSDTGSPSRNRRDWFALIVHFIDGSIFEIAAAGVEVTRDPGDPTQDKRRKRTNER